jgi:hypothetical protein
VAGAIIKAEKDCEVHVDSFTQKLRDAFKLLFSCGLSDRGFIGFSNLLFKVKELF